MKNNGCCKPAVLYYDANFIKFDATRYTNWWLRGDDAKEVGERLNAEVGSKAYGSLSIVVQYYTETSKVLTVPKSVFMPPPNVDSIVVKLMQRTEPLVTVDNEEAFFKLAKAAFAQRRKTINNNYQNYFKDGKQHKEVILQWLEQAGIDPRRRGETLSIQDFAKLYEEKKKFPQLEN